MEIQGKRIRFRDETEQEWVVFEAIFAGNESLCFESHDTVRRVREFPGNWEHLTPQELFALSWKR